MFVTISLACSMCPREMSQRGDSGKRMRSKMPMRARRAPIAYLTSSPWINPGDSHFHKRDFLFHRTLRTCSEALGVLDILHRPKFPQALRYVRTLGESKHVLPQRSRAGVRTYVKFFFACPPVGGAPSLPRHECRGLTARFDKTPAVPGKLRELVDDLDGSQSKGRGQPESQADAKECIEGGPDKDE